MFGFLLSRATAFETFLPFGTAFCAGINKYYSLSALIGVIFGSIHTVNGVTGVIYIGASIVAIALKWTLCITGDEKPFCSAVSALSGSLFCTVCAVFSYDYSFDSLIRGIGETLFATGTAYFISIALPLISSGKNMCKMTAEELCSALIGTGVMLIAISPYTVFGFSVARLVAFVVILCSATYGTEASGGICGIVLGFCMSICYDNAQFIIASYALCGLLAGVFSKLGKAFGIACAMLGVLLAATGLKEISGAYVMLIEAAMSVAIFCFLPKKMKNALVDFFAPGAQMTKVDGLRRNTVMRMRFASDALTDVSETVEEVAKKLSTLNEPSLYDVFIKTEESACKNCGLRLHCYETLKSKTYEAFIEMSKSIRKNGRPREEDYPEKWVSRCISPKKVADAFYEYYEEYENHCNAEQRIMQIRSVVSDQMAGLSEMLYDMADELNESERYDMSAASAIDSALRKMGIVASDVCCKLDSSLRMIVEICAPTNRGGKVSKMTLLKTANRACGRRFNPPNIVNAGSKLLITLTEQAYYKVDVGVSQICCKNEKMCGDTYSFFNDGRGKTIMLLSDGMGCGGRAAVDSSMAAGLMKRLLKAGFGFECSLKLLNSAMMFKSCDESLATVDITAIDLFSGQADFYKAGSPDTIVIKNKRQGRAKGRSCPAGIVRDVSFDKTTAMLDDKNIVIMTSDGVCDSDDDWLITAANKIPSASAQQIAEQLCQMALRRRDDGHEDDITVMVGILNKTKR